MATVCFVLLVSSASASLFSSTNAGITSDQLFKELGVADRALHKVETTQMFETTVKNAINNWQPRTGFEPGRQVECAEIPVESQETYLKAMAEEQIKQNAKLFSFVKCSIPYNSAAVEVIMRYKDLGKAGGEIFIMFRDWMSDLAHPYEFSLKSNVHVESQTDPAAELKTILDTFATDLTGKLNEFWDTIQIPPLDKIKDKIMDLVSQHYTPVNGDDPKRISQVTGNLFSYQGMVRVKKPGQEESVDENGIDQTKLEIKIYRQGKASSMSTVEIQLGSKHFRINVPNGNIDVTWGKIEKDVKESVDKWFIDPNSKYQMAELNEVKHRVINIFKGNQCFEIPSEQELGAMEQETSNYFTWQVKRKFDEQCKEEEGKRYGKTFDVFYFSYQYGFFNYGHLFLDSELQSAEYLLDLNEEIFPTNLEAEIGTYIKENEIALPKNSPITELKMTDILTRINNKLGTTCEALEANPKKQICSKNQKTVYEVAEFEEPEQVFRIKFIYPSRQSALRKDSDAQRSSILTNTLVLQRYNSYDQLERLEPIIAEFLKNLSI